MARIHRSQGNERYVHSFVRLFVLPCSWQLLLSWSIHLKATFITKKQAHLTLTGTAVFFSIIWLERTFKTSLPPQPSLAPGYPSWRNRWRKRPPNFCSSAEQTEIMWSEGFICYHSVKLTGLKQDVIIYSDYLHLILLTLQTHSRIFSFCTLVGAPKCFMHSNKQIWINLHS